MVHSLLASRALSLRRAFRTRRTRAEILVPPGQYSKLQTPAGALIDESGNYRTGWFTKSPTINLDAFRGSARRLHRWFFIHFDCAEYFVGANVIDLGGLGGNVGIVVLDKNTGEFQVAADTQLFFRNRVEIDPAGLVFTDGRSGSFIRINPEETELEFRLLVRGTEFTGRARAIFERPFCQATSFENGLGTLQNWGNIRVESATIRTPTSTFELPAGTFGAYDRSLGHRRLLENWNWIATCGIATSLETGKEVPFALHAACDRGLARPRIESKKFSLWLGDEHHVKLPGLTFDYQYTNASSLDTTPWMVTSPNDGDTWVDLTFSQRFHRRDLHRIPLVFHVDHSQYFGEVNGVICVAGERFTVKDVYATTEDSMMVV